LVIFAGVFSACGLVQPGQPSTRQQTETAIAFDVIVQATLQDVIRMTEAAGGPLAPEGQTSEPVAPVETPSPTLVPDTPTPNPTDIPIVPYALINQNTNCRSGPGTVFDLLYIALIGDKLPIIRISTLVDYVLIEIPGKPGELCWLWTNFAQLMGNYQALPVSTPPPTPTPEVNFKVVYDYMDGCVGWDPAFKLTNNGDVTFKSYYVTVTDTVTSVTYDHTASNFDKTSGCPVVQAIPQLDPGMTGWAHAYSFLYDPAGNQMTGSIKLCTGTALGGTCVTKSLSFVP
jgi:hypothetical protein